MANTLLGYLTQGNPVLNEENSLKGTPTRNSDWPTVSGVRDWTDFTYETLMACYGDVLVQQFQQPFPGIRPNLSSLECEIWDEDSLEHLLSRSIIPAVSTGLAAGWYLSYPRHPNKIDITRGGRAKNTNDGDGGNGDDSGGRHGSTSQGSKKKAPKESSLTTKNNKSYPDWAGVGRNPVQRRAYINRCPGDTKLSTKWESTDNRDEEFFRPISQILSYCGEQWDTRYGYIITQTELVVLRFSREPIDPGLAAARSPRRRPGRALTPQTARLPEHQRNISAASATSGRHSRDNSAASIASSMERLSVSSAESGSIFEDDNRGGEYGPVDMKSIPWDNEGTGKLTVKLALWWLHMLAAAPGCQHHIGNDYPPLNSWVETEKGYQHLTTGFRSLDPKKGRKYDSNSGRRWMGSRDPSPPSRGSPSSNGSRSSGGSPPGRGNPPSSGSPPNQGGSGGKGKGKAPERPRKR